MNSTLVKLAVIGLMSGLLIAMWEYHGQQQFKAGERAERSTWLTRETDQLLAANAKIKSLEEQYRQQEQDAADAIAIISFNYQKDLQHVQAEKDRVISGLRDGTVRLFVPTASSLHPDGGAPAAVAAPACGCDAAARAELSGAAAEFLVGLASEADEVAKQLGRCQEIIKADRRNQGESNGSR